MTDKGLVKDDVIVLAEIAPTWMLLLLLVNSKFVHHHMSQSAHWFDWDSNLCCQVNAHLSSMYIFKRFVSGKRKTQRLH